MFTVLFVCPLNIAEAIPNSNHETRNTHNESNNFHKEHSNYHDSYTSYRHEIVGVVVMLVTNLVGKRTVAMQIAMSSSSRGSDSSSHAAATVMASTEPVEMDMSIIIGTMFEMSSSLFQTRSREQEACARPCCCPGAGQSKSFGFVAQARKAGLAAHISYSQYYGYQGPINLGQGILYMDYLMGTTRLLT